MGPKQTAPRTENYSGWDGTWPKGGPRSVVLSPVDGDPMTLLAHCKTGPKVSFILVVERHEVPLFIEHMYELNVSVHLQRGRAPSPAPGAFF